MAKRILKAREIDRLENTTFLTTIAVAYAGGSPGDTGICGNCERTCLGQQICDNCTGGTCGDIPVVGDVCSDCGHTCLSVIAAGVGERAVDVGHVHAPGAVAVPRA